jgi:hypothetical protein
MSHFHYVLLFLLASSAMAALLQSNSKEEFLRMFGQRFLTPLAAFAGVSWLMFLLSRI